MGLDTEGLILADQMLLQVTWLCTAICISCHLQVQKTIGVSNTDDRLEMAFSILQCRIWQCMFMLTCREAHLSH